MAAPLDIADVYRRYGSIALRRARQILGDEHEAMEVLHEIFAALVAEPDQFHGRSQFTTWLYSATTHRCLNRLRDRRNRARLLAERVEPATAAAGPATAEHVAAARELLLRLPDELARIAVYYYFDEMTHGEIAELVGCSRRHVGNLLDRVRREACALEDVA